MRAKAAFSGNLSVISLPDVFQILGGNNCTGVLRITSQFVPTPGIIYFANGNAVNADSGPLKGIDAIYALFGWTEGEFEFHHQEIRVEHVVHDSRMAIILDALRMLDDGLIKKVGHQPFDEVAEIQAGVSKYDISAALPVLKGALIDYRYVIEEEGFRDGERIVPEGGYGNWFWVILDGIAKVSRETSRGPVTLLKLGEGCFIGSLASFSFTAHVRNSTATAEGHVQLGVLDIVRLCTEHSFLSSDFRGLLLSLDRRLRKTTDRVLDMFMDQNEAEQLTGNKEVIVEEGSSKGEVLRITKGEGYVMRQTQKGYLQLLTLAKGDILGDLPFIDMGQEPHYGSVLASKDLKTERLDTESLQKEYDNLSGIFRSLVDNVVACVFATTRLACHLRDGK